MLILPLKPRRALAGAATTALAVVLFCRYLLRGNPGIFFNDDYQISILPVFADIARAWNEGNWPLLSPYSWACGNLAGEYQYGTFSVFINAATVLIWKFPLTFAQQAAALSVTHMAVLAAGAYLLARTRRLPASLAAGVGIIAALNGWEMGWGATDWFGAVAANAWLPWCWWAFEVALRKGGNQKAEVGRVESGVERLRLLLPVPFVYLLLTAGFPYTVVMLGLVSAWLGLRTGFAANGGWWRALRTLGVGWGLGLMLSAPAWLSLLDAVHGSGRSSEGVGVGNTAWAVPWRSLPGLILPNWTSQWADFANLPCTHGALELAGGLVPTVGLIAAVACLGRVAAKALKWDLLLCAAVLALCLLPSPGLFRWSFRWLPLLHLALALTGGRGLHLLASRMRGRDFVKNPGLWATAVVGLTWLAMKVFRTGNPDPLTAGMAPCMLAIAVGWAVVGALPVRRSGHLWGAGLAVLAAMWGTYRYAHTNTGLPIYPVGQNLARIEPLSPDRLYLSFYREPDRFYRIWQVPPGFGPVVRMGSMGLYAGVRMVNGYSPIMSEGVGKLFHIETHGSVPESVGAGLLTDEAGADGLLARLGVDGIIVTHDYQTPARPPAEEWKMVKTFDEGDVYERKGGSKGTVRAWTSAEPGGPDRFAPATVRVLEDTRQRVEVDVSVPAGGGAALIAFHRPFYPGYRATLDGKPVPVGSFRGMLPTVELPAGSQGRLVLRYLPRAVVWGVGIAAAGALLAVGLGVWAWRERRVG